MIYLDGYCDDACRTEECLWDDDDCELGCNDDQCSTFLLAWWYLADSDEIYLVSVYYACLVWNPRAAALFPQWGDHRNLTECIEQWIRYDHNNDKHMNFR